MSKKVIVDLSSEGIDKLLSKLSTLDKKLENAQSKIVDDLAKYSVKRMKSIYESSGIKANKPMTFYIADVEGGKEARMAGEQAIYTEFGTGTVGAENPHPIKGSFELNDYNSGKTIRKNKSIDSEASKNDIPVGGLYWTYKDEQGNKIYTQGIVAQKEGYTAFQDASKKVNTYVRKRVGEVLDDFN